MKSEEHTIRDHLNSPTPIFTNIANRINYLEQKKLCVDKNLLAYMNCFELRLLSQRFHNSESKEKNSSTLRIHPSKKIRIKQSQGKLSRETNTVFNRPKLFQRNDQTESENKDKLIKNINNLKSNQKIGLQLNEINQKNKECDDRVVLLQISKKKRKFLSKGDTKSTLNCLLVNEKQRKIALKTDNFLKTNLNENKSPYTKIIKCLAHRKDDKKQNQQKMKLIQIKKKLLEEQEKSLMEYEKCIMYKQKIAQKIKHENLSEFNTGSEKKKSFKQNDDFIQANEDEL